MSNLFGCQWSLSLFIKKKKNNKCTSINIVVFLSTINIGQFSAIKIVIQVITLENKCTLKYNIISFRLQSFFKENFIVAMEIVMKRN